MSHTWKDMILDFVAVISIVALIYRNRNYVPPYVEKAEDTTNDYTPVHRCIHGIVATIPGEPTIGPYYQCDNCGMSFGSHGQWVACSKAAEEHNRRYNV